MNKDKQNKECCEKCYEVILVTQTSSANEKVITFEQIQCSNKFCPCHTQAPQKKDTSVSEVHEPYAKAIKETLSEIMNNPRTFDEPNALAQKKECEHKNPAYNKETCRFYCKDCGKIERDQKKDISLDERFDEKYSSVYEKYPEYKESHSILLNDIKDFISKEIQKAREQTIAEIVENFRIYDCKACEENSDYLETLLTKKENGKNN